MTYATTRTDTLRESRLADYLRLRLIVGYLGESDQFGWWPTSFYQPSSRLFLEPVFAKTSRLAQYHGVKEAARRLHDEHIGIGRVFHLFRLPEEIEQDLHKLLEARLGDDSLLGDLADRETALGALRAFSSDEGVLAEGPVAVGKFGDLLKAKATKEIAQRYLGAFNQGVKTYPYFAG